MLSLFRKCFHHKNHRIVKNVHHKNCWIQKSGKHLTFLAVSKLRNYFFFIGSQGRESIFFDVRNYPSKITVSIHWNHCFKDQKLSDSEQPSLVRSKRSTNTLSLFRKSFHHKNRCIVKNVNHKNRWIQKSGKHLTILTVSKLRNYFFYWKSRKGVNLFWCINLCVESHSFNPLNSLFQRPEFVWLRTTLSSQIKTEHKHAVTFSKKFSSQKSLYSKKC